jgi:nucleoside-diphosphate-sugar epimerase
MKALVTGATGFLGGALAHRLHALGWDVTAMGRDPARLKGIEAQGIRAVQANLEDAQSILDVCRGQEIVFHSAALANDWGRGEVFYKANVLGTQNVIRGCQEHNVKRLVHVSTPSIYFRYAPRINVKETDPLPPPVTEYARTKRLAEDEVDKAFAAGLPTVTIRPRAIFGPGDRIILPRLINRLQRGILRVIGDGQNLADMSYIENVVDALLLCAEAPAHALGKKYNITNGEPIRLWAMVEKLCQRLDLKHPTQRLPYPLVDKIAGTMEFVARLLPGQPEPPLTRYSVAMVSLSTTLDISAARRDLGYTPRVSNEEGFEKFVTWWIGGRVGRV